MPAFCSTLDHGSAMSLPLHEDGLHPGPQSLSPSLSLGARPFTLTPAAGRASSDADTALPSPRSFLSRRPTSHVSVSINSLFRETQALPSEASELLQPLRTLCPWHFLLPCRVQRHLPPHTSRAVLCDGCCQQPRAPWLHGRTEVLLLLLWGPGSKGKVSAGGAPAAPSPAAGALRDLWCPWPVADPASPASTITWPFPGVLPPPPPPMPKQRPTFLRPQCSSHCPSRPWCPLAGLLGRGSQRPVPCTPTRFCSSPTQASS